MTSSPRAGTGRSVARSPARSTARSTARRPVPDLRVERELLTSPGLRLAGLDEVGRGALAGPVTVGAVVVDRSCTAVPPGLRDSKLLSAARRDALVAPVRSWAVDVAVGHAWPDEIDAVGIVAALRMAAWRALARLRRPVDVILLDGTIDYLTGEPPPAAPVRVGGARDHVIDVRRWTRTLRQYRGVPVHLRVRGDQRCASVAAASVVAKTTRDALMVEADDRFPAYGWRANKGYGTAAHLDALRTIGASPWHRHSWTLPGTEAGRGGGGGADDLDSGLGSRAGDRDRTATREGA